MEGSGSSTDDKGSGIWSLLPSFDPSTDNAREYLAKVKFLDGICPKKDRPMLAPRLAMLCKGTAWHQVRALAPELLTDPTNGIKHFLAALESWEESSELRSFELFERAIYKTVQKSDETTQSYVNRLMVAFDEVGPDTTLKSVIAFILLKQSNLNHEDKKKVLTMTNGVLEKTAIEGAMRSLSTNVLTGSSSVEKKKIYPTNFIEADDMENPKEISQTFAANHEEDEELSFEAIESLAAWGDADALTIQAFEKDLEELMQEVPDLHTALVSYHEARAKINERKRNRGFWPAGQKGSGKGFKSGFQYGGSKGFRKGSSKGKDELLQRISRTHCKKCGELGHWKAECPNKAKDSVNIVTQEALDETDQVMFETLSLSEVMEVRLNKRHETNMHESIHSSLEHAFVGIHLQNNSLDPTGKIKIKMQQFFANRSTSVHFARQSKQSIPSPILKDPIHTFPSCTSNVGKEAFDTQGYAIVDTGASRSVIGSENLPQMMRLLDPVTRARSKEKASRIGFRFGNNQIEYSFKQVWIPIRSGNQQIWLIIEVVPKRTPFLLSIQTMRKLGAVLDLQKGTCFMHTLGKAVSLRQGNTGLLMISLADLCHKPPKAEVVTSQIDEPQAFIVSRVADSPESSNLKSHAHSSRGHGNDPRDGRCSDATAQAAHESGSITSGGDCRSVGTQRACPAATESDAGSPKPEAHVAGDLHQFEVDRNLIPSVASTPHGVDRHRREGDPSLGRRNDDDEREEEDASQPHTTSLSPTDIKSDNSQAAKSGRSSWSKWSPLPSNGSSHDEWTHSGPRRSTSCCRRGDGQRFQRSPWPRFGMDSGCNDVLGTQSDQLGKETSRQDVLRSVRIGRSVHKLVFEPLEHLRNAGTGLCKVLSSPEADGSTTPAWSVIHLAAKVTNSQEVKWLRALRDEMKSNDQAPKLDLLEVYAQPNSRLAEEVIRQGGKAIRFTFEHGDLSTFHGQMELLRMLIRYRPKHVWVAPECAPWCSWNRFNAKRSVQAFDHVQNMQEQSKEHLQLCAFICKIQIEGGRHFSMENPGSSGAWQQKETQDIIRLTKTILFDQCQFGLKHPQSHEPMKKATRVQTTSREMMKHLDGRTCTREHVHCPIAGNCQHQGRTFALSRFAAFYPHMLARKAAKGILFENQNPGCPIVEASTAVEQLYPVREAEEPPEGEPGSKRKRGQGPLEDLGTRKRELEPYEPFTILTGQPWTEVMDKLQTFLPKSGAQNIDLETWPGSFIRQHCQIQDVQEIKAIKGVEKFMTGNLAHSHRQTISLCRKSQRILDLGVEAWTKLTQAQQRRKAIPSHIMITIFGRNPEELDESQAKSESSKARKPLSQEETTSSTIRKVEAEEKSAGEPKPETPEEGTLAPIPSWMPVTTINSGPKFLELNSKQQTMIRKMHNNLGHPVAERLSEHLKRLGFTERMVEGARDYHCQSCAERVPPKLTTPGKLKEPREFNERVALDGFEWKGPKGEQVLCSTLL